MEESVAIPEKKEDLEAMGYTFDNDAMCRGCQAPIEWWITPKGKKMPMSVVSLDANREVVKPGSLMRPVEIVRRPHWGGCPNAGDFRRGKP
jgi:hypothetical protein